MLTQRCGRHSLPHHYYQLFECTWSTQMWPDGSGFRSSSKTFNPRRRSYAQMSWLWPFLWWLNGGLTVAGLWLAGLGCGPSDATMRGARRRTQMSHVKGGQGSSKYQTPKPLCPLPPCKAGCIENPGRSVVAAAHPAARRAMAASRILNHTKHKHSGCVYLGPCKWGGFFFGFFFFQVETFRSRALGSGARVALQSRPCVCASLRLPP
ncbi:hypothetical protein B0H67DRAFT_156269 [Lasiosphaeris hirsuta]|uniref:Uncharacterized protein n=1 Tax=Lasiosphaeris hirsuta TaxID=260670 RepID=A0AA40APF6_9PEZI|nr:hypothetical protein B0H67DRAFT_156269 [Lasiosphaeris hirsuta]